MPTESFDLVVLGGGIVGLATAQALTAANRVSLAVLEAESQLASHQSGRNSGVVHSGLYYPPGSLKARLCVEGRNRLYRFCERHGVPFRRCGKLVVATRSEELAALAELARRGRENGLQGVQELDAAGVHAREPMAAGLGGLWVPETGVVDYRRVCRALAAQIKSRGGQVRTSARLIGIEPRGERLALRTAAGVIEAGALINCAGLQSDRVARLAGARLDCRIVPFRGEYYELRGAAADRVRGLVYPVPDSSLPFLGIHLTRTIDGRLLAGPNAVPAASREGYTRGRIRPRDLLETALFPGFWRLAARFWRTGAAEIVRSASRRRFRKELARLTPALAGAELIPSPAGVRAQAVDRQGRLLHDFRFADSERALHVINAPSPAATAALAIGRYLCREAAARLGWQGAAPGD